MRQQGFAQLARRSRPDIEAAAIDAAFRHATQTFRHWWKVEHHTPPVAAWLKVGLDQLDIDDPDGLHTLADQLAGLEVEIPPQPVPHVHEMLEKLYGTVPMAIVSDTINTPADGLRRILDQHDLSRYFEFCAFSDEVGASKPAANGFAAVSHALGIAGAAIAHVGDRQETDVDGIQRYGGVAVLYTGAIDRHHGDTTAEITCADYRTFVAQLDSVGGLA
jgi:FMN phosphatase YigB (HAD superfamily)